MPVSLPSSQINTGPARRRRALPRRTRDCAAHARVNLDNHWHPAGGHRHAILSFSEAAPFSLEAYSGLVLVIRVCLPLGPCPRLLELRSASAPRLLPPSSSTRCPREPCPRAPLPCRCRCHPRRARPTQLRASSKHTRSTAGIGWTVGMARHLRVIR